MVNELHFIVSSTFIGWCVLHYHHHYHFLKVKHLLVNMYLLSHIYHYQHTHALCKLLHMRMCTFLLYTFTAERPRYKKTENKISWITDLMSVFEWLWSFLRCTQLRFVKKSHSRLPSVQISQLDVFLQRLLKTVFQQSIKHWTKN